MAQRRIHWPQYVESVDHFFNANGITDADKKKSAFLAVIGLTTYTLVRNLVSPAKPGEKSYDELVNVLKEHFNPTPSETVQRSRFHGRFRKPGETVATFFSELRSLAEICNFGGPSLFSGLDYWTGLLDSRKLPLAGNEHKYTEIRQRPTGKTWLFSVAPRPSPHSLAGQTLRT